MGQKYFERHQTQFLVHVPARIKKRDSNSEGLRFPVPHNAFMGELNVPTNVTLAEQKRILKDRVMRQIQQLDKTADGTPILYEDSDPVIYDDDGEWTFDVQTVVETNGEMQTAAVLDRSLGACPLLPASMYSPEGLCPEALIDHNGHCVPQQLSKLLKTPLKTIEKEIGKHLTDWRGVGVPTDAIAKIAGKRGMPLYIMHNGRKIR